MVPRKSSRLSRCDKEKEVEVASDNNKAKRKRSLSKENTARGSIKKTKGGRLVDNFCWKCHELASDKICSTCPRAYHDNCLLKTGKFKEDVCPECQLLSVDGTMPSSDLTADMIDQVFMCLIRRLMPATTSKSFGIGNSHGKYIKKNDKIPTNFPELMKWPERKYKTCKPVDLGMLIEAIKHGGSYSRTIELFSDVQWIYHNSYKCFGAQSEITKAANKIVKSVRSELLDIEACYECYYRNYNEIELYDSDPFPLVCKIPHTIVWAKLKGHPFWPSKVLKVLDNKAQIQFFGTHDKNSVDVKACFLMSRRHPTPNYVGQKTYRAALGDLQFYIQNYERKHGPFPYAAYKTQFCPADDWHWVKEKPQFQSPSPKQKGAKKSLRGRKNVSLNNDSSNEAAAENEETDHNTGGDPGLYIVISSIRGVSNEDSCNYQNATDSWTSPFNCPSLSVCIPRLDDSVAFQYQQKQIHQTNSGINLSASCPVITNSQSCDESAQNIHESVAMIDHLTSTSHRRLQALSHSEHIDNIQGFASHCNENSPGESRASISYSRKELEDIRSFVGLKKNIRETDPEMLKILFDGGHFIKESGRIMLEYSNGYYRGIRIISSILNKIKQINAALKNLQNRKKELEASSRQKLNPYLTKIMKGTIKMAEFKTEEDLQRFKNRLNQEKKYIQNMLLFNRQEALNYIKRNYHENHTNKNTQISMMTEVEKETYENKFNLEKMKLEKEHQDKIFEIKSQVWCIRCEERGKIYCCWNSYYCTEACRIKDLENHKASCSKMKFSGHTVMIEEITDADCCDDHGFNIMPMVEEI